MVACDKLVGIFEKKLALKLEDAKREILTSTTNTT